MSEFELGKSYTRRQIHNLVSGSVQPFLPDKGGRVVCACLTPKLNSDVPNVILVGAGGDIYRRGRMLVDQSGAIPVFLKNGSDDWHYAGEFEVERASEVAADIALWQAHAGRADVRIVIHMRKA